MPENMCSPSPDPGLPPAPPAPPAPNVPPAPPFEAAPPAPPAPECAPAPDGPPDPFAAPLVLALSGESHARRRNAASNDDAKVLVLNTDREAGDTGAVPP